MIRRLLQIYPDDHWDGLWEYELGWWIAPFVDFLGPVFSVVVMVVILTMSYIYTGSVAIPTMLCILIGGWMMAELPAEGQIVGGLFVVFGVFIALYSTFDGGRGL